LPPNRETLCAISHVESDALTITMVGELDMARECELLNLMVTLDPLPGTVVKLDLSELTFADSAGLRSIVNTQAYLRGRHCELHLVRPQQHLLKLIELVGITDYFTIVDGQPQLVQDGEAALHG
jgi:anti-anti-sigma factor